MHNLTSQKLRDTVDFTGIKETCVYIRDLEGARNFYVGKLGLTVISELEGKHIFFRAGASVLLVFNPDESRLKRSPPPHYSEGPYHFAFEVEPADYDRCKKEIEDKEIEIIDVVRWQSGQESFYFNDPFGNVLEVVPRGIWE